jgi:hypothetical protein
MMASGKPSSAAGNDTAIQNPFPTSHASLFLTNLHLLDLDLLPDWPDINVLTLHTKDVVQSQKKRIQSVEWALYQLFVLWDPEEARSVGCSDPS